MSFSIGPRPKDHRLTVGPVQSNGIDGEANLDAKPPVRSPVPTPRARSGSAKLLSRLIPVKPCFDVLRHRRIPFVNRQNVRDHTMASSSLRQPFEETFLLVDAHASLVSPFVQYWRHLGVGICDRAFEHKPKTQR